MAGARGDLVIWEENFGSVRKKEKSVEDKDSAASNLSFFLLIRRSEAGLGVEREFRVENLAGR